LQNLYDEMKEKVDFYFRSNVDKVYDVSKMPEDLPPVTDAKARYVIEVGAPGSEGSPEEHAAEFFSAEELIISIGRSGSKWMETVCDDLGLEKKSNRVDIGIRVELPHEVFSELTDELYESKIVYRTKQYNDLVRTFCMNPHGVVVNENTNGIVTVNGHSYEDPAMHTENTNFALLVTKHFTEPFKESNDYGESIARLSNMLGGGVIVQRFGDLISGRRTNESRLEGSFVRPTLAATPGDLSLVIPKRIMDDIIEMVYALDKIAPGTANQDTLLYGVEVKFYNMEVKMGKDLDTGHPGLYVIGDGSGVTHSLSHASASGVFVARRILGK
ncbi:MAG: FAD-dependent oxidoreductase, partial [Firmicutes bacterium]|nr:FAD-dependent oxidoreductase [Bacillota bacterium]